MKTGKKFLSLMLVLIMCFSVIPMADMGIEASAVTFSQLNDSSVFLKQLESRTCTLCASAMMMRRYSMLRGDSGWKTITESSIKSTAWLSGVGLYNSFSYSNSSVSTIKVANYSLPGGNSNASKIIEELKKCPEGIVLYNGNAPHAILLTDYTDGVFYCADPANGIDSGRIPISKAYKVTINNATSYWKVTSPIVDGPTGDHIHDYTGDRLYQPEHPHAISQRCVDYDNCGGFIWTGENYKSRDCSQCWDLRLDFSKSSIKIKEGKRATVSLSKSGSCYPEGAVFYFEYDENIINVTSATLSCTIEALKAGSCQLKLIVYADRNNNTIVCSDTMAVTVVDDSFTLSYNANGGSGAPSNQTGATSYAVSSTVPTRQGYTFLGWSNSSSASSATYKPGDSISLSANTTLYAVWKSASSISISTSYNTNIEFANQEYYYTFTPTTSGDYTFESTGSLDTKVYVYNSSWTELGYNDDGGTDSNFKLKINLTSGTKYYIKVRAYSSKVGSTSFSVTKEAPATYTLTYNANGGSGAPSSVSGSTSYTISSNEPTKPGYAFLGWSTSSSASSAAYKPGSTINLSSNTMLYAVWKKVFYGDVYNDGLMNNGDVLYAGRMVEGLETASTFAYLLGDVNGDGTMNSTDVDLISKFITKQIDSFPVESLYSKIEISAKPYKLTYKPGETIDTTGLKLAVSYYESANSLSKKACHVVNSGYTVSPKTLSGLGQQKITVTLGSWMVSYYVTVEDNTTYTLTYNANNGGNAPSSQSGATSYTISSSVPTRLGHTFLGWSTSSSASSATYKPGQTINLSSNTTLYAVWKSTVAVSEDYEVDVKFDFANQDHYYSFTPATSGEYSFISISAHFNTKMYIYNSSWTQLDFKNGFDSSCELTVNLTAGNKYYVRLSGTNLSTGYAVFGVIRYVPDTYTLTYNANGGTNAPSTQTGETSYQISPIIPRRTGYTFVGWSTNSNATSPTYKPWQTINLSSNITLYAVWEKNHEHSYTSVTTSPDCVNPGSIKYTCTCGESYSETIPALGHSFNGDSEQCQLCGYDRTENCGCNCHKGGIAGFFFKIILFFQKLFKTNKVCACGVAHY